MRMFLLSLGVLALVVACGSDKPAAFGGWTSGAEVRMVGPIAAPGPLAGTNTTQYYVAEGAVRMVRTCVFNATVAPAVAAQTLVADVTAPAQVTGNTINVLEAKTATTTGLGVGPLARTCTAELPRQVFVYTVNGNRLKLSTDRGVAVGEFTRN